ncbi:hypothetical protein FKM82_001419 [Ascaphus truei]
MKAHVLCMAPSSITEEQSGFAKRAAPTEDSCRSIKCDISGSRANSQARPYPRKPHQVLWSNGGKSLQEILSGVKKGIHTRLAQNEIREDPTGVHTVRNTIPYIGSDAGMDWNTNNNNNIISWEKTHPGALDKHTGNRTSFVMQPEQSSSRFDNHHKPTKNKYNSGTEMPKYLTLTTDPPTRTAGSSHRQCLAAAA